MNRATVHLILRRFLADYGILLVLLAICAYLSLATIADQPVSGAAGGKALAWDVVRQVPPRGSVLIVARDSQADAEFVEALQERLSDAGIVVVEAVRGEPRDARKALAQCNDSAIKLHAIATNDVAGRWSLFEDLGHKFPALGDVPVLVPRSYRWPNFLTFENLLNIANQIAVIAILAIGMTMVIITGGIDLSVGSLMALSAVFATLLIRDAAGAEAATPPGMVLGCLAGIALGGGVGLANGALVTVFGLPPFISTLGMMLVASGTAYILAAGQSIYQLPPSFVWLGRAADLGQVPNAVLLMLLLYVLAHVLMSRTTLGRYIYAVGGNIEAARLSGVPVRRVLLFVYSVTGVLAGLGGVILASQLKSGSPKYGELYELYVIAAVVVGGTSLSGGEGRVFGTLIGAFLIAVIQNGMNLTGVESYTQKVVLGAVIIGAVLLDRLKQRYWKG
jgi:ribose transport system permease protein